MNLPFNKQKEKLNDNRNFILGKEKDIKKSEIEKEKEKEKGINKNKYFKNKKLKKIILLRK
jgi:hypothetical protein